MRSEMIVDWREGHMVKRGCVKFRRLEKEQGKGAKNNQLRGAGERSTPSEGVSVPLFLPWLTIGWIVVGW